MEAIQISKELEQYLTLKIERSQNDKYFFAVITRGRALRPYVNYAFRTSEQREQYIKEQKENVRAWEERKQKEKEQKANFKPTLKAGDILNGSWGYDQTNQEFYKVIEVKGKTAFMQKVKCKGIEGTGGFMCEDIIPTNEIYGDIIKRRIQCGYNGKDSIKLNECCYLDLWDGKEKYSSWYA